MNKKSRFLGAILLIAGTTIGAGMLALPLSTGQAGFLPAFLLMSFVFIFMMLTAFYFLEVNLKMPGKGNFISLARVTLGRPGECISWVTYLLLLYALMAAYLVGCSQILEDLLGIKHTPFFVFIFFFCFLYFGTRMMDLLNRLLMIGLFASYSLLVVLGVFHVDVNLLKHVCFPSLWGALPVVITSFGYHIIIPTLVEYLDRDAHKLTWAILIGSFIPFLIYLLWQFLMMGLIPVEGECGLRKGAEMGVQATIFLKNVLGNKYVIFAAKSFGFFAIVTSLIGVALSLSDFLADGLRIKKSGWGKIVLGLLTFIPPLFFALYYPQGFVLALNYAGIFVIILLAILPLLMAYSSRYFHTLQIRSDFRVGGGKKTLLGTLLVSVIILGIEIFL